MKSPDANCRKHRCKSCGENLADQAYPTRKSCCAFSPARKMWISCAPQGLPGSTSTAEIRYCTWSKSLREQPIVLAYRFSAATYRCVCVETHCSRSAVALSDNQIGCYRHLLINCLALKHSDDSVANQTASIKAAGEPPKSESKLALNQDTSRTRW